MSQLLLETVSEWTIMECPRNVKEVTNLIVTTDYIDYVQEQLDDIAALEDGWDEGCKAYRKKDIELISFLLKKFWGPFNIEPALYPAAPNDIVAEWTIGKMDVILRFFLDTYIVRYSTYINETQEYYSKELNIKDLPEMRELGKVLQCVIR